MNDLAAFALCFAGFFCLAAAMDRHQRDLFHRVRPRIVRPMRVVGWGLLAASIYPLLAVHGDGVGLTVWFGIAAAAAVAVILTVRYAHGRTAKRRRR